MSSVRQLNYTFDTSTNRTGYTNDPSKCVTARDICTQTSVCDCTRDANCDAPMKECYYTNENFIMGDAISTADTQLVLRPVRLLNSSTAVIVNAGDDGVYGPAEELLAKYARMGAVPGCYSTGRYVFHFFVCLYILARFIVMCMACMYV